MREFNELMSSIENGHYSPFYLLSGVEPSFIDHTARKLAEIKEIPKEELVKITTSNFNNLFFK